MSTSSISTLILFLVAMFCISAADSDFFLRSAKWVSKMSPSGGSLVSGRGGFRPGFFPEDWRRILAEPNFVKRSSIYDY